MEQKPASCRTEIINGIKDLDNEKTIEIISEKNARLRRLNERLESASHLAESVEPAVCATCIGLAKCPAITGQNIMRFRAEEIHDGTVGETLATLVRVEQNSSDSKRAGTDLAKTLLEEGKRGVSDTAITDTYEQDLPRAS